MTERAYPVVPSPTSGVDGRVALATALHAAPGAYAVLVGSGLSSAAGVPTSWQVVQDLLRQIALAEGVDPADLEDDPERWWAAQGRAEPRYDTLLPALSHTDAARQTLLRRYFEWLPNGAGRVHPTEGHRALASLVASGRIRVIITTNFDRLIERALDEAGIPPQVISTPGSISGMEPLVHAPATVIKLHGDYLSLGLRNTADELAAYPDETLALLHRIFDEYGLLILGWSGEYDTALVEAVGSAPSRRYPTYWATFHGGIAEPARRLIAARRACVINTEGADEFLTDIVQKVERLDQVARRRRRPTPLRTYSLMPEASSPSRGWAVLPLLQLRAAAAVSPASQDTCGLVRAENREALMAALQNSPFTDRIRAMAGYPAASASAEPTPTGELILAPPLTDWLPTPGSYQSTEYCSYRLGGDAEAGVSALVTVRFPAYGLDGSVVFTVDVALSLQEILALAEATAILRDGLVLVTAALPDALAEILPSDSQVSLAEVHVLAADQDGKQNSRDNPFLGRLDLSSLGQPTRDVGPTAGFAAQLSTPLTDREAAGLVCDAMDYIAHSVGYLDPRAGLRLLREELGVAVSGAPQEV